MYSTRSAIFVAKSQLDYHEGRVAGSWNNIQKYSKQIPGFRWSDGQPWCLTFVQWCLWQTGIEVPEGARSASCRYSSLAFRKAERFTEYPVTGAVVFYGTGGRAHAGLCTGWDDTFVYTIEGNTNTTGGAEGDGVYAKKRLRRDDYVYGYGLPYYPHDTAVSPGPWSGKSLAR